ncbi:MAG: hypothetical protein U0R71_16340 [Solirubrobacterales bacterium]
MKPPTPNRRTARRLAIAVLCLLSAGLGTSQALAAPGGLAVTPGILEHVAQPGGVGSLEVANRSARSMRISVALRPWLQSRSGAVTPNRRGLLGRMSPNRLSFRLRAGAARSIPLRLTRRPSGGSLYGAVEVTGTPQRGHGKNIEVAYRLITSLRLFPAVGARRYRAQPGRLFQHGSTRRGALYLTVKNRGNTIDPIGGKVRIRGQGRTLSGVVSPQTILPGATVNVRLTRLVGNLPRGHYQVGVRLTQAGHKAGGFKGGVQLH